MERLVLSGRIAARGDFGRAPAVARRSLRRGCRGGRPAPARRVYAPRALRGRRHSCGRRRVGRPRPRRHTAGPRNQVVGALEPVEGTTAARRHSKVVRAGQPEQRIACGWRRRRQRRRDRKPGHRRRRGIRGHAELNTLRRRRETQIVVGMAGRHRRDSWSTRSGPAAASLTRGGAGSSVIVPRPQYRAIRGCCSRARTGGSPKA